MPITLTDEEVSNLFQPLCDVIQIRREAIEMDLPTCPMVGEDIYAHASYIISLEGILSKLDPEHNGSQVANNYLNEAKPEVQAVIEYWRTHKPAF